MTQRIVTSRYYMDDDRVYPRVSLVLDTISTGFGLFVHQVKRAVQTYMTKTHLHDLEVSTDIIKEVIRDSKADMEDAAEHGTAVHNMLDNFVRGTGELDDSIEAIGFTAWMNKYKPVFIHTELFLKSDKHGYAGTTDGVIRIGDRIGILDYKTSNKIYNKYSLQLTSYAMAYEEKYGQKIDFIAALQLGKNKKGWFYKELERDDETWLATLRIFNWLNPNFATNAKKNFDLTEEDE